MNIHARDVTLHVAEDLLHVRHILRRLILERPLDAWPLRQLFLRDRIGLIRRASVANLLMPLRAPLARSGLSAAAGRPVITHQLERLEHASALVRYRAAYEHTHSARIAQTSANTLMFLSLSFSSGLRFGISVLWWGWCFVREGVVVRVGVVGGVAGCLVLGVVGWFRG